MNWRTRTIPPLFALATGAAGGLPIIAAGLEETVIYDRE
jgi:hypothetical protein